MPVKDGWTLTSGNMAFRKVATPAFRLLFHSLAKVEIQGRENIPASGPYLVVFNHVSLYDPPFVVAFWSTPPEVLGAVDIWSRKGQATLARWYGGIPIQREEVDRKAMYAMLSALQNGRPLALSPEGGRSHQPGMRRGKAGIIFLVDKINPPVVPVGVVGTTDDFLKKALRFERPLIKMTIGKSFFVPTFEENGRTPGELRQQKVDYIMLRIAELLPEEYRGVYS